MDLNIPCVELVITARRLDQRIETVDDIAAFIEFGKSNRAGALWHLIRSLEVYGREGH